MGVGRPRKRQKKADLERNRRKSLLAVAAAIVVIGIAGSAIYSVSGSRRVSQTIGGPFTLVDSSGRAVTNTAWPGKYLLVYFGYTVCPDVCPTTLGAVAGALDRLGPNADRLKPLFITLDPDRDTPAVLAGYTAAFTPRLVGLTGTPAQIAEVAREYRVYYAAHRTGSRPDDYVMDHSSILFLMAPDGHLVASMSAEESAAEMAAQISHFIS
jgi:protein SCO1/2